MGLYQPPATARAMRSPFPGMDPYLEAHWADVHARLTIYASEQIQQALPADFRARVEERVFVEADDGRTRSMAPDVRGYERATHHAAPERFGN